MRVGTIDKRVLTWAGRVIAIGAVVFVSVRLFSAVTSLPPGTFTVLRFALLFPISGLIVLANFMLAVGWYGHLRWLGENPVFMSAIRIHGTTQIGKYIPGNVFHLAGRQAVGMKAGLSGKVLAKSTGAELSLLVIVGATVGMSAVVSQFSSLSGYWWLAGAPIAIVLVSAWALATRRLGLVGAVLCYYVYVSLLGASFLATIVSFFPEYGMQSFDWVTGSGYVFGWLVGLITPGAPAGIGVREAVLSWLLQDQVPVDILIVTVVLTRIVSILGDIFFFLLVQSGPILRIRK